MTTTNETEMYCDKLYITYDIRCLDVDKYGNHLEWYESVDDSASWTYPGHKQFNPRTNKFWEYAVKSRKEGLDTPTLKHYKYLYTCETNKF